MYDLIVCGGGPGGLTAARVAAQKGLKVILFERKRSVSEVHRLCGQFTNLNMISVGGKVKYGFSERISLEVGTTETLVHLLDQNLTINYNGPVRPYYNYIFLSPSGHPVYRERNRFFAFYWDKQLVLERLLDDALKAGVEIITGAICDGVENRANGVRVLVRDSHEQRWYEGRKGIDATGRGSKIAQALEITHQPLIGPLYRAGAYIMEGIECELRHDSYVCITVPSLNRPNLWMFMVGNGRSGVGTVSVDSRSPFEITDQMMKLPFYAPWFRHARVVGKMVTAGAAWVEPVLNPVKGNWLCLGEAAGINETSNPGAMACGNQAARAMLSELDGKPGYHAYINWWQTAFEGTDPAYLKAAARFGAANAICNDEELDFLYRFIGDEKGVPAVLVGKKLDELKNLRPGLYEKFKKTGIDSDLNGFKPPESDTLFKSKPRD